MKNFVEHSVLWITLIIGVFNLLIGEYATAIWVFLAAEFYGLYVMEQRKFDAINDNSYIVFTEKGKLTAFGLDVIIDEAVP